MIKAVTYAEPISRFLILVGNNEGEVKESVLGESMHNVGFHWDVKLNNGISSYAIVIGINRSTTPSFPIEITFKSSEIPLILNGVLR